MAMNLQPNPSPDKNKNTFPTGSVFFHDPDGKPLRALSPTPSSISHSVIKKSTTTKIISPVAKKTTTTNVTKKIYHHQNNLPRHQKIYEPFKYSPAPRCRSS